MFTHILYICIILQVAPMLVTHSCPIESLPHHYFFTYMYVDYAIH